jgi:hypothetical protein
MKKVFTIEHDNKDVELAVIEPTPSELSEARKIANVAFNRALSEEAPLQLQVEKILVSRGIWDDNKVKEIEEIRDQVRSDEKVLKAGGIKRSEGKVFADRLSENRNKLRVLLSDKERLNNITAEAQMENSRFEYLVSRCVVYNKNGKKYFKDLEEYRKRADSPAALEGARLFAIINYGLDEDFEKNLPENKFLRQFGYVNEDLRYIDTDGRFVDAKGRLVNENGRYVDADGNLVDIQGNKVDENGELLIESKPFLDDDTGKPIVFEKKDK